MKIFQFNIQNEVMEMNMKIILGIFCASLFSACASQYKIGQVEALGLQADERLVFNYKDKICAEPSPDAVKSIAEAVAIKAADYGELSQSYASTMASIGLRHRLR